MKSLAQSSFSARFAAFFLLLAGLAPLHAATIDFEDKGVAPGGVQDFAPLLTSGGFEFVAGPNFTIFDQLLLGSPSFWPSNGTTILLHNGDSIMTKSGGGLFSLQSVDLAGFNGLEDPIHVIGTYANDTTVTQIFTLDGIEDGAGGQADFQTFFLSAGFTGLKSINFLLNGTGAGNLQGLIGIDNIVVDAAVSDVPEPTSMLLLLTGLAGVVGIQRRRKA